MTTGRKIHKAVKRTKKSGQGNESEMDFSPLGSAWRGNCQKKSGKIRSGGVNAGAFNEESEGEELGPAEGAWEDESENMITWRYKDPFSPK